MATYCHGERGHLVVGDVAVDECLDQRRDFAGGKRFPSALAIEKENGIQHRRSLPTGLKRSLCTILFRSVGLLRRFGVAATAAEKAASTFRTISRQEFFKIRNAHR